MLALWTTGLVQKAAIFLTLVWIFVGTVREAHSFTGLGLRGSGFRKSLWIVAVAALVAALLITVAWKTNTLHATLSGFTPEISCVAYFLWALIQQFILIDVFLERLLKVAPTRSMAVMVTALLFSVAHIPNALLIAVTLVWGIAACVLFLHYRNLYTLALAHAIVGLTLAITVPDTMHHQMRVGMGYVHWHTSKVTRSTEPNAPNGIHGGMSDSGTHQPPVLAPGPAVENAGYRGQQDVTPVEMRRAFVEVR